MLLYSHAFEEEVVKDAGSNFLTTPLTIVNMLSVFVPVCTPAKCNGFVLALISKVYCGDDVPIPNLEFVLSQVSWDVAPICPVLAAV